jgi:hypothetical protein
MRVREGATWMHDAEQWPAVVVDVVASGARHPARRNQTPGGCNDVSGNFQGKRFLDAPQSSNTRPMKRGADSLQLLTWNETP